MICEIVSIGTEILMGQIANTDGQYLSERMAELGISVYRHVAVGDNMARAKQALSEALNRADLVITTGGLGPTEDDLTKEAVAELFELPMRRDPETEAKLKGFACARGHVLSEIAMKQADFPEGCTIMPNARGTAPGCIVEHEGKLIAVLPGPPRELRDMFEKQLGPLLARRSEARMASRFLQIVGIGESQVQDELRDLFHQDNPTLALYCGAANVTARITARTGLDGDPEAMLVPLEREIRQRLGTAVYAEGRGATLAGTVFELMLKQKKSLAVAESCTGGMLASLLAGCPGASKVLLEGHVTYNDKAKMRVLGVRSGTLDTYGAVSAECACEMAAGARLISDADCALSVTGFAGPDGGTDQAPLGTCFIGLADRADVTSVRFQFTGDRNWIRTLCCQHALNLLRLKLLEFDS